MSEPCNNLQPATENLSSDQPFITVDYERYAHLLEETDLTDEQKREYLQALWGIIVEFVSLGWGVHPLQQTPKTSRQPDEDLLKMGDNPVFLDRAIASDDVRALADLSPEAHEQGDDN